MQAMVGLSQAEHTESEKRKMILLQINILHEC